MADTTTPTMHDILTAELRRVHETSGLGKFHIMETGSIRTDDPVSRDGYGWSTLTFANHCKTVGGTVTSIDLDTSVADRVLRRHKASTPVHLFQGDSRRVIGTLRRTFGLVLLDSGNDPDLTWDEFVAVIPLLLDTVGVVVVDDVSYGPDTHGVKGCRILAALNRRNAPHRRHKRWGGKGWIGMLAVDAEIARTLTG